jgi:hypothetical protein
MDIDETTARRSGASSVGCTLFSRGQRHSSCLPDIPEFIDISRKEFIAVLQ